MYVHNGRPLLYDAFVDIYLLLYYCFVIQEDVYDNSKTTCGI